MLNSLFVFLLTLLPVLSIGEIVDSSLATQGSGGVAAEAQACVADAGACDLVGSPQTELSAEHSTASVSAYPVRWTHGCGWTATYWVHRGQMNWFWCHGCRQRFYIVG
jgi:hypothetical protein